MRNLLYYYCGGGQAAVIEFLVSLDSLLRVHPQLSFRVGIGLDAESAQLLDINRLRRTPGIEVSILDQAFDAVTGEEAHTFHVVNRWSALQHFDYERALILDIDTVVNRPLDKLFDQIHQDPEYFTTFASFSRRDRKWKKHQQFYDATGVTYPATPLYCAIGLHAVRCDWPHIEQMKTYCRGMDRYKRANRVRRAFVEEFSISLVLLQNGGKVHFPARAIRKAPRREINAADQEPHVWHFILGRARRHPLWRRCYSAMLESDISQLAAFLKPSF